MGSEAIMVTKPTWRTGLVLLALLLSAAWAVYHWSQSGPHGADAARQEAHLRVNWAIDPSDEGALVDAATDVFVGRIVEVVGTQPLPTPDPSLSFPQTQFSVKVGKRLKGHTRGTVVVNQVAGTDSVSGVFVALGDDTLLEPAQRVLLITEFDPDLGWYHLIASDYSHKRVRDDKDDEKKEERRLLRRYADAAGLEVPADETSTSAPERSKRPTRTAEPTDAAPTEPERPKHCQRRRRRRPNHPRRRRSRQRFRPKSRRPNRPWSRPRRSRLWRKPTNRKKQPRAKPPDS